MKNRRPFSYCVLRYVHDPVANEAMNIGVMVYSPDHKYLSVTLEYRYERLSAAFSDFDGEGYRRALRAFDASVDELRDYFFSPILRPSELPADAGAIARRIWPDQGLSFRNASPGAGLSADLIATSADLFGRFVSSQNDRTSDERRTDEEVWASLKPRLSGTVLKNVLEPRTFATEDVSVRFEYAFKNERWHVLRPVSLDYARSSSIRRRAAELLGECVALSENADLREGRLYLLLGAPTQPEHADVYIHAKRMLDRQIPIGHELIEERDAGQLVARLEAIARMHAGEVVTE
jgi:Protein of unknown function (DUF3037)